MLTLIGLILAATSAPADPLAPIRAGRLRCGLPDPGHKTCRTIARYDRRADGGFDVTVDGLISDTGVAIHYRVPLVVKHGALCVTIGSEDLPKMTFSKAGTPLTGSALAAARDAQRPVMLPFFGRQVCSRDQDRDGVFLAESYVDGQRFPNLDKPVLWIDPKDGYALGPMPGDAI